MRVIIAGGRDFGNLRIKDLIEAEKTKLYRIRKEAFNELCKLHSEIGITTVISGCATGADTLGMEWANTMGIKILKFPADWKKHGKIAGFLRNAEMAGIADAVVLFPGGAGTKDMYEKAKIKKLKIYDWRTSFKLIF